MNKKSSGERKRSWEKDSIGDVGAAVQIPTAADITFKARKKKEDNKLSRKKKKIRNERKNDPETGMTDALDEKNDNVETNMSQSKTSRKIGKSKKTEKKKKKNQIISKESGKERERSGEVVQDNVYHISSGDKDFTKGMKKWIMEYHQSRPGIKVLQQRIDDFIVAHEEKLEQEKEEKIARAAEGGWTVVTHLKGRKKTTESETGITVGSVAQAAVEDKLAKKKSKEVGLDFYRFQRKEAQRNELMMLQSKFEEDKKRIQQLRAARKFRPY